MYSPTTGNTYLPGIHTSLPPDAIPISNERYQSVIANPTAGKVRSHDAAGLPILVDPPPHVPTAAELCAHVDTAADEARRKVAGDPLRAVEYDRARVEAERYAAAGYVGEVPPMVAAWAINGRTARQAAESILSEAAQYTAALVQLRELRLGAKEKIRAFMKTADLEQARRVVDASIMAIENAVRDVGNNASEGQPREEMV
ncbi:phage tail protein [Pseudomonas sp. NP21570]|nr:phage tail protein [Pseudomonas sp. NP21570]